MTRYLPDVLAVAGALAIIRASFMFGVAFGLLAVGACLLSLAYLVAVPRSPGDSS